MVLSFALETPLLAATPAATTALKVNGQTFNVSPGTWVKAADGTWYSAHYINGRLVTLDLAQFTRLSFGDSVNLPGLNPTQTKITDTPISKTSTTADAAVSETTSTTPTTTTDSTPVWNENAQRWMDPNTHKFVKAPTSGTTADSTTAQPTTKQTALSDVDADTSSSQTTTRQATLDEYADPISQNQQSADPSADPALPTDGAATDQTVTTDPTTQAPTDAAQTDAAVDQTTAKPGLKEVASTKFKSGYEAGKAMTNAGFQNVKDNLTNGFKPTNILLTAGVTIGVDLATQIMRGEKPSAKKALQAVCCAEFAGGVVGSVTGAAAGSFFVPFLYALPAGPILAALAPTFGAIVGGSVGAYMAGDLKNGKFSIQEAFRHIDWVGVAGQTVGSTLGAMLGSFILPPLGTILGGIIGGYVGNLLAHKIAGLFGKDSQTAQSDTVTQPSGSNPLGSYSGGSVSIDTTDDSSSDTSESTSLVIDDTSDSTESYESQLQLSYAKYQELYKLYAEYNSQQRYDEAQKVAVEVNKAKKEFEALKAKSSK